MKVVGITTARELTRLGYPIDLTLRSFGPAAWAVVAADENDPEGCPPPALCLPDGLPQPRLTIVSTDWSSRKGAALFRWVLRTALHTAIEKLHATHVLYLEADEAMRPGDVAGLVREAPPVAWLPRYQFWRDLSTIRLDWTVALPRWASVEALLPSLDKGEGDASALPVKPEYAVAQFPWPIFHYSRVGNPRMIAARRRAVARLWVGAREDESDESVGIEVPDVYDFAPRRYENWEKGKMPPMAQPLFAELYGEHPPGAWAMFDPRWGER